MAHCVGSFHIRLLGGALTCLGLVTLSPQRAAADEIAKMTASDGVAGDQLGFRVGLALDGDTLLVGAAIANGQNGAAYVFQRDHGGPDNWGEVTELLPSAGGNFGNDLGISGDTAVVGARTGFGPATHTGRAYVFERSEGGADNWGQVKVLQTPNPFLEGSSNGRFFGQSVAIADDWIFIGEYGPLPNNGRVHVFARDTGGFGNWGFVKTLFNPDPAPFEPSPAYGDHFAITLDADGDTLVVGAMHDDNANGINAGAGYVFQRDQGGANNWGLVAKLLASDGQPGDRLTFIGGASISGDTIVLGSCGRVGDTSTALLGCSTKAGKAYVFERDGCGADSWCETRMLTASDGHAGDGFGLNGVAISGDRIVIGAHANDDHGNNAGAVYLFARDAGGPGQWGEVARLTPTDLAANDLSGHSVAVACATIAAASPGDDNENGENAGAVYILAPSSPEPGLTKELTQGPDADGDGEIDLVVEVGQTAPTEIELEISFVFDALSPEVLVLDTAPAEWQVTAANGLQSATSCISGADGNGGDVGIAPATGRCNHAKSATKIRWTPAVDGVLALRMETRGGKGGPERLYSPTSCGELVVNEGALAVALDGNGHDVLFGPTDPIVLVAVADVNGDGEIARDGSGDEDGDGLTDAEEVLGGGGTDPCDADSDDDGVPDGFDLCPLEGDAGGGVDPEGCPL